MCTRFYIEPDNDETRELIAVALHSKLADAFIRGGSPIQRAGSADEIRLGQDEAEDG